MRLLSLLVKNYELASNLEDLSMRAETPIGSIEQATSFDDWVTKLNNKWVSELKTTINNLSPDKIKKLQLSEPVLNEMHNIISEYYKAQTGVHLSFNEFFADHPTLTTCYSTNYDDGLYDPTSEVETIYLQAEVEHKGSQYVLSSMVAFDNPQALDYIHSFQNINTKSEARMQMIEDNEFHSYLDISVRVRVNGRLKPLATFNHQKTQTTSQHEIIGELTTILERDYKIMNNFTEKNASLIDYTNKRNFISDILSQCRHDSFLNGVSEESIEYFKIVAEESLIEKKLKSKGFKGIDSSHFTKDESNLVLDPLDNLAFNSQHERDYANEVLSILDDMDKEYFKKMKFK